MNRSSIISPGISPITVFRRLEDQETAALLLPSDALRLVRALAPETLKGDRWAQVLASLFSIELAISDRDRRRILFDTLGSSDIREIERRAATSTEDLLRQNRLTPDQARAVQGFFGYSTSRQESAAAANDSGEVVPERALFPHQKAVAHEVERLLYRENGRAILHLPTGVGKTRTAMSVVASHLRSRVSGVVLWLAATRELLEQASIEFVETWGAVGDRRIECVRFWSDFTSRIDGVTDGVVVAGLSKLHSYGRDRERLWSFGDRVTMVVFDEAHQAVAPTYLDLIETIVTRNTRTPLLGLTATPGRTWDRPEVDELVADLFFGNKVTLDFGGANPINRLTEEGYLAATRFSMLDVQPGVRLSVMESAKLARSDDISEALAERLGRDDQRNISILRRLRELSQRHARVLVFAASVENALLLERVCNGLGIGADAVTAKTDAGRRDYLIRRFKRIGGAHRVLINYGVLTTGFDAPMASAALIARPTKSLVLYSQMVGRVIRGPLAGGTSECEIVTVVDTTLPGFRDVAESFLNWEDVWETS